MILVLQCFIEFLWFVEHWVFNDGGHLSILHTPSSHKFLNLQSLKSQNKCLIFNNPIGLANINIWTSEATWCWVNFRSKEILLIMFMWNGKFLSCSFSKSFWFKPIHCPYLTLVIFYLQIQLRLGLSLVEDDILYNKTSIDSMHKSFIGILLKGGHEIHVSTMGALI